jgi:hypothetical protein
MCQRTGEVEAHHVAKLAHLGKPGQPQPPRAELMARKRRRPSSSAPTAIRCGGGVARGGAGRGAGGADGIAG